MQPDMDVINGNYKLAGIDLEKILTPAAELRPNAAQTCVQRQVPHPSTPLLHTPSSFLALHPARSHGLSHRQHCHGLYRRSLRQDIAPSQGTSVALHGS